MCNYIPSLVYFLFLWTIIKMKSGHYRVQVERILRFLKINNMLFILLVCYIIYRLLIYLKHLKAITNWYNMRAIALIQGRFYI